MKFSKKLTAAAAIVAAGFASNAAAETATDTIEVYAGLAAVLEMTCSDVNFGVWRVPTGDRSGTTTVTLAGGTAIAEKTVGEVPDNAVAVSNNHDSPSAGTCTVTGSSAVNATGTAEIITGASGSFAGTDDNPFATGLDAPTGTALGSFTYTLSVTNDPIAIDGDGEASFLVDGTMVIPNNLVSNNYGAYKGVQATVEFDDTQPDPQT